MLPGLPLGCTEWYEVVVIRCDGSRECHHHFIGFVVGFGLFSVDDVIDTISGAPNNSPHTEIQIVVKTHVSVQLTMRYCKCNENMLSQVCIGNNRLIPSAPELAHNKLGGGNLSIMV